MLVNREKSEVIELKKFRNYNHINNKKRWDCEYFLVSNHIKKPHVSFYKCYSEEISENKIEVNAPFFSKIETINYTNIGLIIKRFNSRFLKKEKHVKKYYSDPFSSIYIYLKYRSIYETDEKFTIVLWEQEKKRFLNFRYFKKNVKKIILSINKKTGNITTIRGESIRVNSFSEISNVIFNICRQGQDSENLYTNTFNNETFYHKVENFLKNINSEIKNEKFKIGDVNDKISMRDNIIKYFIFKRKIVVPDNYLILFDFYPGENILKKNNRNILLSILRKNNINRKSFYKSCLQYLNRQVNSTPSDIVKLDVFPNILFSNLLKNYKILEKIFGNEFESYFGDVLKSFTVGTNYNETDFEEISNIEKINFVKILKTIGKKTLIENVFRDLIDHLVMLKKIREIQNISLKSNTHKTFVEEHLLITKYFRLLKRGVVVTNLYPIEMIKKLEEPIIFDGNIYKPYVLKKTEDYIEEGLYMNHCVSGYDTVKSVIISIRKDNERITNEYDLMGGLLQTRGKYNSQPTDDFLEINKIINKKIKNLYYDGDFIQKKEEVKTFMLDTIEELKF